MLKKITKLKNFTNLLKPFTSFNTFKRSFFCNIYRLNVDKLNIGKEKETSNFEKQEQPKFNIDDNIIEYKAGVSWEEVVIKSEIPVVVDVYAK
jgi:hypothetical protein